MSRHHWKIAACLFLVLATLAVYGQVLNYQFVNYDDDLYITDNPTVQNGLTRDGLGLAFTSSYAGLWHPLTMLSHMLGCELFGLNPGGHHLINLLFHIANALLLFLWLQRTTQAMGPSFLVAALFALHPLHVESVAWVAERKDVLSTFFWLLTMWAYVWYVEAPRLGRYLLILLCFMLGLMSKPMLVTLPFVLLLLDYWPLNRWTLNGSAAVSHSRVSQDAKARQGISIKRLAWEKAPLFALATLFSLVTFWAEKKIGAVQSLENVALTSRLANALVAYVTYLGKMIWPTRLAVFYPLPGAIPLWQWLGAGLTLAFLSLLIIRQCRRRPYLLVGWLWYLGTLVPVIGLVQVGGQALADRYTYVPLIGLFILVAYGMAGLGPKWRPARYLLPVGAAMILAALMICTWIQVQYWRDSASLFAHALQVTKDNALAHDSLGIVLLSQGQVDQAIDHFDEAVRLNPNYAKGHYNLGNALLARGEVNQAVAHYERALQIRPNYAKAHNSLGLALLSQGKMDEAIVHCEEALRLQPNYVGALNNLGLAFLSQGKMDQAVAQFEKVLRFRPNSPVVHNNLGLALLSAGQDRSGPGALPSGYTTESRITPRPLTAWLAFCPWLVTGNFATALPP